MTEMENSLQAAIDAGKINGAVICATDAQGHFVYNKALGERTLLSGEKRPQKIDDILYLASATKLVATIAALQCVEDGLLTLDGDLSSIIPELSTKQVLTGFSEDGNTQSKDLSVEELFCYPLAFHPGTSWMYGSGLDWAGRIVERVTGETLISFIQRRIFNPLGIKDGQFYPVTREDLQERLVDLNPDDPTCLGRAVLGGGGDMNARTRGDFGGHGLFLPGSDYIKILHSLLASDGKLLTSGTVDEMFEHQLSPEATVGYQDALSGPAGIFFRVGTEPGAKVGYGLGGVLTLEDVDGWYGERTLTWGGGLTLAWFIDRKNDLCGVGAVQSALPVDVELVSELKQIFRHDIYRKKAAWEQQSSR
ncbi:unnamed protein product [Penicillium olsonii]|uniref:Beta-lactamase-related domain-containing protein n=1 Tax=Penicillium olsonii TaxID=99116 RepID=A0A9W4HPC3_PENOL|nr:unnamed protein product [Penicillium olsonii]CAG8080578.1 unnamed protein product [Penicillium olsonii]